MVKAIESFDEFKTLINSGDIIVVDYWATWCGPCKMISPHFAKMEEKYPNLKFFKVDVDEQEEIARDQTIKAMPTFAAYKDGKRIKDSVGAVPAKLTAMLDEVSAA